MQLGITKIIDGIFIGDQFVATDFEFIFGNKVSHLLGWSVYPLDLNMEQQGIYHINIPKPQQDNYYPQIKQIKRAIQFIQSSKQQYLCCLIYSDRQSDAALILAAYLMFKFKWTLKSVLFLLRKKTYIPELSQQIYTKIEKIEQQFKQQINLIDIQWSYEFLSTYQTQNEDEMIVINTIKNTLRIILPPEVNPFHKVQHNKRVQWQDRVKYSANKLTYQRNTSLKKINPKQFFVKPQKKQPSNTSAKKIFYVRNNGFSRSHKDDELGDEQFFSIKQFSRTNIDDPTTKSKIRKRQSIKQTKSEKNLSQAYQRPQSGKKNNLYVNTLSAKDFLNNLKSLNKLNLYNS